MLTLLAASPSVAQTHDTARALPADAPRYLRFSYPAAMAVPVPAAQQQAAQASQQARQQAPLLTGNLEQLQTYRNGSGKLGIYQSQGAITPANNAFFQSLGSNGRSCFSCHRPADGMSLTTGTLQQLFTSSNGADPVFAPVDAANCPSSVPRDATLTAVVGSALATAGKSDEKDGGKNGSKDAAALRDAYSLLLSKGLFRVFLPMPRNAEFTVTVVSDPYGCNTQPAYALQMDPATRETQQMVSVYRRPRMSANLVAATTPALTTLGGGPLPNIDFVTGLPVVDPKTGLDIGGNLMWDGREATLAGQAIAATLGHAQALQAPTPAQVAEIVSFESGVFAAQSSDSAAGDLLPGSHGAFGGPQHLAGQPLAFGNFALFDAWPTVGGPVTPLPRVRSVASANSRAAIARGQTLFNNRAINVGNVAGFNNAVLLGVTNPTVTTCASCHGNMPSGGDPFPAGQRDIGIGGQAAKFGGPPPAQDLPVFKLQCKARSSGGYYGHEVLTNDPGLALISGRCADIGRRSVPQLRALAARAPYFSDGSAASTDDVVRFYNLRFGIGLTPAEIKDMAAFLRAL